MGLGSKPATKGAEPGWRQEDWQAGERAGFPYWTFLKCLSVDQTI